MYMPIHVQSAGLAPYRRKDKITAGLLGIFLGAIGAHKFYLGQPVMGVLYVLFCWTGIPFLVGFIEGLVYLVQSQDSFDWQHNYST